MPLFSIYIKSVPAIHWVLFVLFVPLWAAGGGLYPPSAVAQPFYGAACPQAQELLEFNDLLFATGFMCRSLDQAFHAAYDPWPPSQSSAPFRSVSAGIAATVQRLAAAKNYDEASIHTMQLNEGGLKRALEAALKQSKAGTVEALFLFDDLRGKAFRLGSGFNWEEANKLMTELLSAQKISDAQQAFRYIVLGAVLAANERDAEPFQSVGWTTLPLWENATEDDSLRNALIELEQLLIPWQDRSVLYLRLGARQFGFLGLSEQPDQPYSAPQCRPKSDWPQPAVQSFAHVLKMDRKCANVAPLALRDWDQATVLGITAPAWPLTAQ